MTSDQKRIMAEVFEDCERIRELYAARELLVQVRQTETAIAHRKDLGERLDVCLENLSVDYDAAEENGIETSRLLELLVDRLPEKLSDTILKG